MEHRWVEIHAAWPGHRPALGVNSQLSEVLRVVERRKDRSTVRSGHELELSDQNAPRKPLASAMGSRGAGGEAATWSAPVIHPRHSMDGVENACTVEARSAV